jgi:hypothetical protein
VDLRDVTLLAIDDFNAQLDTALDSLAHEQWR